MIWYIGISYIPLPFILQFSFPSTSTLCRSHANKSFTFHPKHRIFFSVLVLSNACSEGWRHSAPHDGPPVPLSVLHGAAALHEPHQGAAGGIRLRTAAVPTVRQILPRRPHPQQVTAVP